MLSARTSMWTTRKDFVYMRCHFGCIQMPELYYHKNKFNFHGVEKIGSSEFSSFENVYDGEWCASVFCKPKRMHKFLWWTAYLIRISAFLRQTHTETDTATFTQFWRITNDRKSYLYARTESNATQMQCHEFPVSRVIFPFFFEISKENRAKTNLPWKE